MSYFDYKKNELHCEDLGISKIAEKYPTPFYLYSYGALCDQFRSFNQSFKDVPHLICYSMKANSSRALLRTFIKEGSGIDVVTGGELQRAMDAGCNPKKIVFAGVGKSAAEIRLALKAGILQFNVESEEELAVIAEVSGELKMRAPIALRVNPDVDPKTHPYISTGMKKSKFGIHHERAIQIYKEAAKNPNLEIVGIDCHIGSQLTTLSPFADAAKRVKALVTRLRQEGIALKNLDMGGGLGIVYKDETPPSPEKYAGVLKAELADLGLRLILEPGRFLVGNAGILVTRVLYNKEGETKKFVIVDAASNDLMRPALYGSHHAIQPVVRGENRKKIVADVVGPICETGDFLAQDRELPEVRPGELLAVMSAGAYGASMASVYNSRPSLAEFMVKDGECFVIREAETLEDIVRHERVPGFLK